MNPRKIFRYLVVVIGLIASSMTILGCPKEEKHEDGNIKIMQSSSGDNSPNTATVSQAKK